MQRKKKKLQGGAGEHQTLSRKATCGERKGRKGTKLKFTNLLLLYVCPAARVRDAWRSPDRCYWNHVSCIIATPRQDGRACMYSMNIDCRCCRVSSFQPSPLLCGERVDPNCCRLGWLRGVSPPLRCRRETDNFLLLGCRL